jgi:hypothetical protein
MKDEDKILKKDPNDLLKNYFSNAIDPFIKSVNSIIDTDKLDSCGADPYSEMYSYYNWKDIVYNNISDTIRSKFTLGFI